MQTPSCSFKAQGKTWKGGRRTLTAGRQGAGLSSDIMNSQQLGPTACTGPAQGWTGQESAMEWEGARGTILLSVERLAKAGFWGWGWGFTIFSYAHYPRPCGRVSHPWPFRPPLKSVGHKTGKGPAGRGWRMWRRRVEDEVNRIYYTRVWNCQRTKPTNF